MATSSRVVLVVPPFASATFPALGASVLAAGCRRRGIPTTVFYASLDFAARVSLETYEGLWRSAASQLSGEAVFRDAAFGGNGPPPPLPDGQEGEDIQRCRAAVGDFILDCTAGILEHDPTIVGFSSVFQQNLSSIAMARTLKQRRPELVTVLGGANAAQPMGEALGSLTDAFDYIFSGEADLVFPGFCDELLHGDRRPAARLIDCLPVESLDAVPVPEYGDYFRQLAPYVDAERLPKHLPVCVHFESSRGCWWGQRSHCTFCGLNGSEMGYRSKSPRRLLQEIDLLAGQGGVSKLNAADNIMPRAFTREVLPALTRRRDRLRFFYEVKANLGPADLDTFVLAGVHSIQPGIESFSSSVLRHLAKGVRGSHNLRLLRDCGSRTIRVAWNLLVGIPGETAQDYEETLLLLPAIEHLQPPAGIVPIRFDRFSPYASFPQRYGIQDLEPLPAYRGLYPENAPLSELAYHFVGRYTTPYLDDPGLQDRMAEAVAHWRRLWDFKGLPPKLAAVPLDTDSWYIEDTRSVASQPVCLAPPEWAGLLERLEEPTSPDRLAEDETAVLPELLQRSFVVEHEGRLLSLVTRPMLGLELHQAFEARSQAHGLVADRGPVRNR